MDSKYINEYEYSNFSQNGEDGIIEFLTNKLVKNNKYFVEIGCGNGLENNSTNLVLNKWSGFVCDLQKNIKQYKRLLKIIKPKKNIGCFELLITLENLKRIIDEIEIKQISFLSLDIDSYDFYIMLEMLKNYIFPKIICVEYNPFFGKEPLTVLYKPNAKGYYFHKERLLYFGASLNAWKLLFKKYEYEFICVDKSGVNAFFILSKHFNKNISEYEGLQFAYTKIWVNTHGMAKINPDVESNIDGKKLEEDVLKHFRNELINVETLI